MRVHWLLVIGYWLLIVGCASQTAPDKSKERIPLGEVKISYFQISEGKQAGHPIGVYNALISREWNYKYGNKLNEIFEQVANKEVAVLDDDLIGVLFEYLNKEQYFDMPATPLSSFNLNELKSMNYFTRVISVEVNGVRKTVCFEKLPVYYQPVFARIQQVIFGAMDAAGPKASVQTQDWKDVIQDEINGR